jgi:hydroxyacylglutathione hydrolase
MIFETEVLGPFVNNVYFVADAETREGVVVDASFEAEKIVARARALDLRVAAVVLTHGHLDHIWGADQVREATGARVLIHEGDRWLYEHLGEQSSMFGFGSRRLEPPDGWLADGEAVRFGRHELRVLHTPGHTPGSVCLAGEVAGRGVVFTGDTLFQGSIGRTDLWGGDLEQELASIRARLFALPDATVAFPGHGSHTTIGVERRSNPFLAA